MSETIWTDLERDRVLVTGLHRWALVFQLLACVETWASTTLYLIAPKSDVRAVGLTGVNVSKYGRKVAGALIQNGILASNVSIYDEGFVKIGGRYEELLGISGDTAVSKKSGLGRGVGIVASAVLTPFPGINLLLPGQRGRISLTIITDKKTHVLSTDQVHETAVRDYQKLLGAGQAVLQQIQLRTIAGVAPDSNAPDLGSQLKQISDLHAQGILSDDEFAAAKTKLLGL